MLISIQNIENVSENTAKIDPKKYIHENIAKVTKNYFSILLKYHKFYENVFLTDATTLRRVQCDPFILNNVPE